MAEILEPGSVAHLPTVIKCPKCMAKFRPAYRDIEKTEKELKKGWTFDRGVIDHYKGGKRMTETVRCPTTGCGQILTVSRDPLMDPNHDCCCVCSVM